MGGDWDGDGMNGSDDGDASSASASPPEPSDAEIYAQVARDVQNAGAALTSGADPSAGSQTPQINGGLLDPRTFPSNWDCGPAPTGAPPTGPVDPETYAEVQQDVDKAQAALQQPPVPSPSPPDPEVEADVRAAQAGLPQRISVAAPPGFRHIDPYPGMNYAPSGRFAMPTHDDYANFLNGAPVPTSSYGPHITFVNDISSNPSPDRPVRSALADMVEHGVVDSGFSSVNINSTTGGHDPLSKSNHPIGYAVDINNIDGSRVVNRPDVARGLQAAFAAEPTIRENYGPAFQVETKIPGRPAVGMPNVKEGHKGHVHLSTQRWKN